MSLFASWPRRTCPDLLKASLLSHDTIDEEEEDECVT